MKFLCYTDWSQLPGSANALFAQAEKGSIFYSRPWFENLVAFLEEDEAMLLACVVAGDQLLAMLPLIMSSEANYLSLKHRYTTHFSLLLADEGNEQVLGCLAQGLSQLPCRSLLLEPVADDDCGIVGLQAAMQNTGYRYERLFRSYNWIFRVRGQSFKDYLANRPARLRNTIARKQRKLAREQGYDIRLFTGDEVAQGMPDYYAVYTASWKANEQYAGFLDGMVEGFSRRGWTRLGVLYVKGKPVAAQLWFVANGKASIFRLSYDEAWKHYSVGSILTSYLMEYVIDTDKVEEIDFLTGNDAYKQDWMSDRRERFALSCVKNIKDESVYQKVIKTLKRILKRDI